MNFAKAAGGLVPRFSFAISAETVMLTAHLPITPYRDQERKIASLRYLGNPSHLRLLLSGETCPIEFVSAGYSADDQ